MKPPAVLLLPAPKPAAALAERSRVEVLARRLAAAILQMEKLWETWKMTRRDADLPPFIQAIRRVDRLAQLLGRGIK